MSQKRSSEVAVIGIDIGKNSFHLVGQRSESMSQSTQYVGLDVSLKETSICVTDDVGKIVWRGRTESTPEAIASAVKQHAPYAVRIPVRNDDGDVHVVVEPPWIRGQTRIRSGASGLHSLQGADPRTDLSV
jgi:hypothetical protein